MLLLRLGTARTVTASTTLSLAAATATKMTAARALSSGVAATLASTMRGVPNVVNVGGIGGRRVVWLFAADTGGGGFASACALGCVSHRAAAAAAAVAAVAGRSARTAGARAFSSSGGGSTSGSGGSTSSSAQRSNSSTKDNKDDMDDMDDMDSLCQRHMELPAHDFAMGCNLLRQIALGVPPSELAPFLDDRPSLVNFRDYDRRTPLHVAASEGHADLCRLLVDRGAALNRSDRWGGSPLDDAHRHRHTDVVNLLKQMGATLGSPSQATCFLTAASEGDVDEVRTLLTLGTINVNRADYDRRTALHVAAGEGRAEVLRILCDAGADVNAKDRWGNRPLDDAKAADHIECISILKSYGAKVGTTAPMCMERGPLLDLMHRYGTERDGVLSMDWRDVQRMMASVGHSDASDDVVRRLFRVADVEKNDIITTEEFFEKSHLFLGGRPAGIILLVGGPGSGKGVLSRRLVKECGLVHLSSGDLLREEVARNTDLGKQVENIMKEGGLVGSALMVSLIRKRMNDHPGKRILLDGFPRSQDNARDLVALCGKPELALHLSCDDTILLERIMKRGQSGEKRADDNFQTALVRVRNHHKYQNLTLDFLREEHVPIVYLDGSATADVVWEQLLAIGRVMRPAVKLSSGAGKGTKKGGEGGGNGGGAEKSYMT